MARTSTSFGNGHIGGRLSKAVKYGESVRAAEDKIKDSLPQIVDKLIAIATGDATEFLMNHKTGQAVEVPVNPATSLKAAQYALNRLGGTPEKTTVIDATPEAVKAGFTVLLGAAAASHWALLQDAPKGADLEVLEAGFTSVEPMELTAGE